MLDSIPANVYIIIIFGAVSGRVCSYNIVTKLDVLKEDQVPYGQRKYEH